MELVRNRSKSAKRVCIRCERIYYSARTEVLPCISCCLRVPYVYGIVSHNYVKVGYTKDIHSRLSGIRSSSPLESRLAYLLEMRTIDECKKLERNLLIKLEPFAHRNEWFNLEPESDFIIARRLIKLNKG